MFFEDHFLFRIKASRQQHDQQRQAQHEEAVRNAGCIWAKCIPAQTHPYLNIKRVPPLGTKVDRHGKLVVPATGGVSITTLQFIALDGTKRFLRGGRIRGCYYPVGSDSKKGTRIICEGFATGATLHLDTGFQVIVAFNAGNLLSVAQVIRGLYPDIEILIAADNDQWTPGNPGLTKAKAAAQAVRGKVLVPNFTGLDISSKPTDWNDYVRLLEDCEVV